VAAIGLSWQPEHARASAGRASIRALSGRLGWPPGPAGPLEGHDLAQCLTQETLVLVPEVVVRGEPRHRQCSAPRKSSHVLRMFGAKLERAAVA
jgi:hypothetical protein